MPRFPHWQHFTNLSYNMATIWLTGKWLRGLGHPPPALRPMGILFLLGSSASYRTRGPSAFQKKFLE